MICTDEEARKKWCPMVRFAQVGAHEGYKVETTRDTTQGNCIASACMMWRWNAYHGEKISENKTISAPTVERGGFCGLGAKP